MNVGFISPDDPRWMETLSCVQHDVYHLPEYIIFSATHEGGTPVAFYAEKDGNRLLMPLLLREIPSELGISDKWYDVTTPYGYASPLLTSEQSLADFLMLFKIFAKENNIVSAFFRLHPLLILPVDILNQHGTLLKHGCTVYVDLSLSREEIWAQTRHGHKKDIRRLMRDGFEAHIDDWVHFEDFISIYQETMSRVEASEFYRFSDKYFRELRTALGAKIHLCTVSDPEGHVATAKLFTITNGIAEALLSGTSTSYVRRAPSTLATDFSRYWAKENDCRYYHMGGGLGAHRDSLFDFKTGFSKLMSDFFTYRIILDEAKYALLVQRWKQTNETFHAEDRATEFFPEYRRPIR